MQTLLSPDINLASIAPRMATGLGLTQNFVLASANDMKRFSKAFSNLVTSGANAAKSTISFSLGVVGEPDIGKSFFTDAILNENGTFTTFARDDNNQLVGHSMALGNVVRSDVMVGGARDRTQILFECYAPENSSKNVDFSITEHALFGEKSNYQAILHLSALKATTSYQHPRMVALCVDEASTKTAGFSVFMHQAQSLRV